jgi:hypothetical protein
LLSCLACLLEKAFLLVLVLLLMMLFQWINSEYPLFSESANCCCSTPKFRHWLQMGKNLCITLSLILFASALFVIRELR